MIIQGENADMDATKIMDAISTILSFNKTAIITTLRRASFSDEIVEETRRACMIITEAGLFQFNVECTVSELLMQIEKFIEAALKENEYY